MLIAATAFSSPVEDVNKLYGKSLDNIYGTALAYSGWGSKDDKKELTACGLMAGSELHYLMTTNLSQLSSIVSVDPKKQKEMENKVKVLFDSYEDANTKATWNEIASSFSRVFTNNPDLNYYSYHAGSGMRNTVGLAENNCLEKFSKMPLIKLNTDLDTKGKLGNAILGDTITNYGKYEGHDNYGAIVEDTSKTELSKDFSTFLSQTFYKNDPESYFGTNEYIAKRDLKWIGGDRFGSNDNFRAKDIEIGNIQFNAPISYISPASNRVYAIKMEGQISGEDSVQLVEILTNSYGKVQMSCVWFSATRILYFENGRLLMIDIPLYLGHIKWIEKTRTKLLEDKQKQENVKKNEAQNFFK